MKNRQSPSLVPDGATNRSAAQVPQVGMPRVRRSSRLDREARALLRLVNLMSWLPQGKGSVRALREIWRMTALSMGHRPDVASVRMHTIDGPGGPIEMRVFSPNPSAQPLPAFLWCHGGGFMVGGLDTSDSICRNIARDAGCIVIAVRYRLAPKHDLLASGEDFLAALNWVAEQGAALGIDTTRLAIGGDSAGGNISAAVAQHVAHHGGPNLRLQVLVYPATELVDEFPSMAENAKGYLLTEDGVRKIAEIVRVPPNATDPWLSPRRHPDLQGLAPAMIVSAGFDPIRDDGLDYAARLRAAAVPVEVLHYAGEFHGFLNFDALVGAGSDALQRIGTALAAAFDDKPAPDRTIEIAERYPNLGPLPVAALRELFLTSLAGWAGAERLGLSLLGRFVPGTSRIANRLAESRLVPGIYLRQCASSSTNRLTASLTYSSTRPPTARASRPRHEAR